VRGKLKRLRERDKKVDVRRKLAKLIVIEAFESRSAIVLEDLPGRTPEHMKDVKDKQLRLRIYRSAFSSMKNAIIEKAREFGVPVLLVNPLSHFHCLPSPRDEDRLPTRWGRCPKGWCLWEGEGEVA